MATTTLTLEQARTELWLVLGDLICNWTAPTDLDQYLLRAARERGVTFPLSDAFTMKMIMLWGEIYALEHLYNRAVNKVKVTMGGKTVDLQLVAEHLGSKLKRLYGEVDRVEDEDDVKPAYAQKLSMDYEPKVHPQKVDSRPGRRITDQGGRPTNRRSYGNGS